MKTIIFIIGLILLPYNISLAESVPVDSLTFRVLTSISDFEELRAVPPEFAGMLSADVIRSYDTLANHTGYHVIIFRKSDFKYDVNRSGVVDIEDLVMMVNYMFGGRE